MTSGSPIPAARRPRRRRKEARPAEIIAAGLAEFAAYGFAAARLEDVANRAGIAKATIFRYFPGKEALFEAALRSRLAPFLDGVAGLVEAHPGPAMELLRALVDRFYAALAGPDLPVLMRLILTEGGRFPVLVEAYHREAICRARELLGRIVARGIASGEFRAGAATELPMALMGPAVMAGVWHLTFGRIEPIPPERFRAAHLAMLEGALLARSNGAGDARGVSPPP